MISEPISEAGIVGLRVQRVELTAQTGWAVSEPSWSPACRGARAVYLFGTDGAVGGGGGCPHVMRARALTGGSPG